MSSATKLFLGRSLGFQSGSNSEGAGGCRQFFTFMLLQPIPHHVILPKASVAIYSLSRYTWSQWPSPDHGFLLILLLVFFQAGWCLYYNWSQFSSCTAASWSMPTKGTYNSSNGREGKAKEKQGWQSMYTVIQMVYSRHRLTPLLCSPKGADAISVSVVLCIFPNAILSYDYCLCL